VTRLGATLLTLAFVAMAFGPDQLWLLVVGAVVFDLGTQATLVAHQAIIYSIDPEARSRLNAVLFVGMFTGMSSGAYLGSRVLERFGWQGVCVLAALSGLAALGVRLWPVSLQGK
jgi:predicted MFS family arabinose efflux permease